MDLNRREVLRAGAVIVGAGAAISAPALVNAAASRSSGVAELDAAKIPKFVTQLFIPPAMPAASVTKKYDYYSLAARYFRQQILPKGYPSTPVFGFGSTTGQGTFHAPGHTIEATVDRETRLVWANQLVNSAGDFVPSLLPVDPTIHWANPPGGVDGRDSMAMFMSTPGPYKGPVPIVVHLHGAHDFEDADGYPDAWYLPLAKNIPAGYATVGSSYAKYAAEAHSRAGVTWRPGMAQTAFDNDQRATSLWYHDHTLGMTRLNIRAGLFGMYNLRGGSTDLPAGHLPGPPPRRGDKPGTRYYEIPLIIQDPSFNADGTQYLPAVNQSWPGPYIPETPVPPIWNGMYYGSTIAVNGNTWPNLNVEPRRYRFRLLNASSVRALLLKIVTNPLTTAGATARLPIWVIGSDGGFLPYPVELSGTTGLPVLPSERYDIVVDFTGLKHGTTLYLANEDTTATIGTTGTVMRFTVVPLKSKDTSIPPKHLVLPPIPLLPRQSKTRQVSFSETIYGGHLNVISKYMCGTVDSDGLPVTLDWDSPLTEVVKNNATEVWEVWNFSPEGSEMVSHVFHMHLVQFQVLSREPIGGGTVQGPHPWELGRKDSCASPTGYITRVKATFDHAGRYVWHCHFADHEDNSMMRPYQVL